MRDLEHRIAALESARRADPLADPHVLAGENVRVAAGVVLRAGPDTQITLGDHVNIYRASELTGPLLLEDGVFLNRGAYVQGHVRIGIRTAVGQHVRIITDTHELGAAACRAGARRTEPVDIGHGVWLGAGVTVLPGVRIGDAAIVAAGAVVASDVEANTLVGGVPARMIRRLAP
jgi:maltose O-acetyltransferase